MDEFEYYSVALSWIAESWIEQTQKQTEMKAKRIIFLKSRRCRPCEFQTINESNNFFYS